MAKLLSKHSSNPLQAPSDDLVNRKYLEELQPVLRREKGRGDRDPSSVHNNLSDTDELMCDSSEDAVYHDSVSYQDEVTSSQDHEGHGELEEEEQTLFLKDSQEQAQILAEIDDLEITVPMLKDDFQLIDRLGEGVPAFTTYPLRSVPLLQYITTRDVLFRIQGHRLGASWQVV